MRNFLMLLAVGGVAAFALTRRPATASASASVQQQPVFTSLRLITPTAYYVARN